MLAVFVQDVHVLVEKILNQQMDTLRIFRERVQLLVTMFSLSFSSAGYFFVQQVRDNS